MVKVKDTLTFIERARQLHGSRYDYSVTQWAGASKPIDIICKAHGKFTLASADSHYKRKGSGCQKCSGCEARVFDTESFIRVSKESHGEKYDYSNSVFRSVRSSIVIVCRKCGPFELASANSHYQKGRLCGCRRCEQELRRCVWKSSFCDCCGCKVERGNYKKRCNRCNELVNDEWSVKLASSMATLKSKTHRRIADGWKRWVVNKQCVLHNRNIPRCWYSLSIQIGTWDSWCVAKVKKLTNRKAEDKWKRKIRNWGRSLSQRERKQAASS